LIGQLSDLCIPRLNSARQILNLRDSLALSLIEVIDAERDFSPSKSWPAKNCDDKRSGQGGGRHGRSDPTRDLSPERTMREAPRTTGIQAENVGIPSYHLQDVHVCTHLLAAFIADEEMRLHHPAFSRAEPAARVVGE
jgi:hypothetical protein